MNAPDTRALTIGEFGRRSGLSIKALRLYDVSGLLPPAGVDPVSGYRRYTFAQLERARRISLLRHLDMPLAVVAEVLDGTDEQAVVLLDRWWAAQEAAMAIRLEAAHAEAYATVAREDCFYPRIMQAYEAVGAHVAAAGLIQAAPVREVYLAAWDTIAATDPFVHVAQPIAR